MTLLQNDVLLGRQEPSLRYLPPNGRRNELADTAIDLASIAGVELDEWEAGVLADSMRLDAIGRWVARECGVVVARQNGKGEILMVRQIAGLFVLGERLQIHSAHEFKTCYEHFRRVKDLIEHCPLLADELLPVTGVRTGAGDQAIETRSGNRLRFIARSRTSGVGFSADTVYLDEAFVLDDTTMGALLPTLSARPNSQLWYTSSAPHEDSSVLHRVRRRALAGDDPRLFYAEWGNEPDVDLLDREAWARANPAMGIRIAVDDIAAEQRSMSPQKFARERLGVPDRELGADELRPIPLELWQHLKDEDTPPPDDDTVRLALDATPHWAGPQSATFSVAGVRGDGLSYVGVREHLRPTQAEDQSLKDRVVARALYYSQGHRTALILPPNSPARRWCADLEAAGVELDEMTSGDYTEARGRIVDAVMDGTLRHPNNPIMNAAVAGLETRPSGDGDIWSRRNSSANIAPIIAATCALVRVPATTAEPMIYVWQGGDR
jgi:hypothetical protein